MSLTTLAVRIPETMHSYLKHKAIAEKKTKQDLVQEIISSFQSQDLDYMQQLNQLGFASLLQATAPQPTIDEACHDA